jgi:mannose-6-phosphate isomerase
MYRLEGRIQHYTWGGNTFLPACLGQENNDDKPFAEYWLGVHPGAPAMVHLGENATTTLLNLINSDKLRHLGNPTASKFKGLPFLLKILDVKDMLSIQVHPNKSMAEIGFERENQLGIELDAPNRNYKDDNHKPEMMVALSEFWLLHGFSNHIAHRIDTYDFLKPFKSMYEEKGIKGLYGYLLNLPQQEVNLVFEKHAQTIIPLYQDGKLPKSGPDFWAARAILNLCKDGQYDKGIFSIYLMNILHLKKGEGIFQGAGLLHAYLEGQNIELMSNSDNVLRAGLSNKYIDIPELLAQTSFDITIPNVLPVNTKGGQFYPSDSNDFSLHRIRLFSEEQKLLNFAGPSIFLVMEGEAEWLGESPTSSKGVVAFFVEPNEQITIKAYTEVELFIATVPI